MSIKNLNIGHRQYLRKKTKLDSCLCIEKILKEYNEIKYFPIVVFIGNGELKNITSELPVIYTNGLLKTIKDLNTREFLSFNQIESISNKLRNLNLTDRKEKRRI